MILQKLLFGVDSRFRYTVKEGIPKTFQAKLSQLMNSLSPNDSDNVDCQTVNRMINFSWLIKDFWTTSPWFASSNMYLSFISFKWALSYHASSDGKETPSYQAVLQ